MSAPPPARGIRAPVAAPVLRPWRAGDLSALVHHANSPGLAMGVSCQAGRGWLLASSIDPLRLAIEVEGSAVGHVGFTETGEIGFWLGSEWWGHGIATEAVRAACALAFEQFGWDRITARVAPGNDASRRVLEKAGFAPDAEAIWSRRR